MDLSTPSPPRNTLNLLNLISLQELQKLQDSFAYAHDVCSVITDLEGNHITSLSNSSEVCKMIRSNPEGQKRCNYSNKILGKKSAKLLRPIYQKCLSCGFIDASAPIIVQGIHIANWQISHKALGVTPERIKEYASEIGEDPEKMLKGFNIPDDLTLERFLKVLDLLWLMASHISNRSYTNLQLERELFFSKKMEEALQKSEEKYRMLFDRMKSPFALCELIYDENNNVLDGIFSELNPAFEEMVCFTGKILGKRFTEIFPKMKDTLNEIFNEVSLSNRSVKFEGFVEDIGRFLEGVFFSPKEGYIAAIFSDITERKIAEDKVVNNERRLNLLVNQIPAIIWTTDNDLSINSLEGSALSFTGGKVSNSKNTHVNDFFCEAETESDIIGKHMDALKGDMSEYEISWLGRSFSCKVEPLLDQGREVVGTIGICYDITEKRVVEEKLKAYQDDLRSLASELSLAEERTRRRIARLIHDGIGHELVAMKRDLRLLENDQSDEEGAKILKHNIQRVDEIIQQARQLTFELSPPALYDIGLVAALEGLGEEMFRSSHTRFSLQYSRNFPKVSQNIRVLLFQMVRELFHNIVKHACADNVSLVLAEMGPSILVEVSDNGKGFDVDEASERRQSFGLFSIRERLKRYGGFMHIHSNKGKGTAITLEIPDSGC